MGSMETRVGSTIAGYRLEAVLGQGGMGVVYLADQLRLERKVALKLLASGLASDRSFRERFEREARQAAELEHPNIVPVFDAGEVEGHLYIAMRYVPGGDLAALLASEGPPELGRAIFMLEQAAAALDVAHAHGLVHRDVKPANILIEEPSGRVFVTDFGIAKRSVSPGATKTGSFLGSVDYAAPEQIEGTGVDARTDVYALGCVLYECLTGRRPYERDSEVAVMHAQLAEPPPAPSAVRPELPEAVDGVVATALAKAKDERYATCGELIRAARAAALPGTPARFLTRPTPAVGAGRGRRREWLVPLALTVAAAGAAVAVTLAVTRGGGSDDGGARTAVATGNAQLAEFIPRALLGGCSDAPVYGGALLTATCQRPDDTGGFFPRSLLVSLFTRDTLYESYAVEARAHGFAAPAGTGACDVRRWSGEATWSHGSESPGGSRFCYVSEGEAVLVWTHEEVDEPDHANVLGIARVDEADRAELLEWWSYWRHRIGRVTY
jgi:predicted Ser/Thr protein kinase